MNSIMRSVVGSRARSARVVRPAGQATDTSGNMDFSQYYAPVTPASPADTTASYGYEAPSKSTDGGGGGPSPAMLGAIGGALGVAGQTISSIINSGNQLQIAQLNAQTQQQIAQLQLQAQRAQQQGNMQLAQQQAAQAAQLAQFQQAYLMRQQPSYTGLYIVGAVVALGIIGTFVVLGARARHNPVKKSGFKVYLDGSLIDTVYFDNEMTPEEVKRSLVNHDGYDSRIRVKRRFVRTAF